MADETKFRNDLETSKLSHESYDEFELKQLVADIKVGQTVQIRLLDESNKEIARKEYVAKYINCHVNFVIQDKGIKKEKVV